MKIGDEIKSNQRLKVHLHPAMDLNGNRMKISTNKSSEKWLMLLSEGFPDEISAIQIQYREKQSKTQTQVDGSFLREKRNTNFGS